MLQICVKCSTWVVIGDHCGEEVGVDCSSTEKDVFEGTMVGLAKSVQSG